MREKSQVQDTQNLMEIFLGTSFHVHRGDGRGGLELYVVDDMLWLTTYAGPQTGVPCSIRAACYREISSVWIKGEAFITVDIDYSPCTSSTST